MVAIGILFWVSVKTITFINRHGLGSDNVVMNTDNVVVRTDDVVMNTEHVPQRPVVVDYEIRERDRNLGSSKTRLVETSSPVSMPDENEKQPNPAVAETPEDPPEVVMETDVEPSSLTPDLPASPTRSGSSIQYQFQAATDLVYDFDIRAELGADELTYRGRNTLRATGKRVSSASADDQVNESTGTGFIVHPDGVVVTCAHVVMGATEILALIDGTEQTASVIKLDEANDLAFLKLDKGKFPYLKLASSDGVRLGQEARAIGYPLTDVLGESIKVTRGEVSGRGGPMGPDGIQIDATINPGNSGGPLVDNSGRVIGITSSLLDGIGVSEVGFAVPSNRMIEIAEELGVAVEVIDVPSEMSTPEVIELVSPATVLLKVTTGPHGVGMDPPYEVRFSGYCYSTSAPTSLRYRSSTRHNEHFQGTMQVDGSGQWLEDVSNSSPNNSPNLGPEVTLPFALGKAGSVGIEPLPRSVPGQSVSNSLIVIQDWKTERDRFSTDPYGLGGFASRRRPPWMRLPTPPDQQAKVIIGKESTTVALGPHSPDGIEVTKTYSVQFDGDTNKEPPIAITGSGKGKFDFDGGRMLSMNYKMTVTVNQDNLTVRIPIAMNYKLLSSADLEAERTARKEREQAREKSKAAKSAAMGFVPANPSGRSVSQESKGEPSYLSVKKAPENRKLNKFNPDQ